MKYKVHEIGEERANVLNENDQTIVECGSRSQAQLVASAINLRDRTLSRLAHEFISQINNSDSTINLARIWTGTILGNDLSKEDADELWELIRTILENTKGPGQ